MENLEKLKKKRATVRAGVTRIINKVDTFLQAELTLKEVDQLNEIYEQLQEKDKVLKQLDSEIDALITNEVEYEHEITSCEEYNEKIISYKFKIRNLLKNFKNETPVSTVNSVNNVAPNVSMKLPKLTIEKFSGDSSLWLEFFNAFENAIGLNPALSKIEKFAYLKSLLTGPAYNCVSGFCLTESNYDSCIQMLKDRYGRKDVIINCHMNKLLNLEPVKSSSNIRGLRKLFDELEISIRNLNSLNVTSGSYGHLLNPIILKLLPDDLTLEFNRKRKSAENFEVTELIEFIKNELECREATLLINNHKSDRNADMLNKTPKNYKEKNVRFKNYAQSTSSFNASVKVFCVFCKTNDHMSSECQNFSDEQKRVKLKKEGRCYKCFLKSHMSNMCRSKIQPCENCKSTNHIKLFCFAKEVNSEASNAIKTVSVSKCTTPAPKENVLLQTCVVIAQSKGRSQVTRLLVDSGSERSFITKSLARELNLPVLRTEKLTLYSFGISEGKEQEFEVHKVRLKNKSNPRYSIFVEVLATDLISASHIQQPSHNIREIVSMRGWELSDSVSKDVKVNILLGADYFWNIHRGAAKKINKNLYVIPTIFGYTIMGKVSYENNSRVNSFYVSMNENNNFDLQSFWKLESVF